MELEKGAVRVLQIFLMESQFRRVNKLTYDEKDPVNAEIDLSPTVDKEHKRIGTELQIKATITKENVNEVEALIRMVGIFEYNDIPDAMLEEFPKVNAPAIIFPFIREHLMSTSLKAGIKPIILAPVNFVQLSKRIGEVQEKSR